MTKRQPRGIPVGGQFAAGARSEADVAVDVAEKDASADSAVLEFHLRNAAHAAQEKGLLTKPPTDFDNELSELQAELRETRGKLRQAHDAVHSAVGDKKVGRGRRAEWTMSDDEALDAAHEIVNHGGKTPYQESRVEAVAFVPEEISRDLKKIELAVAQYEDAFDKRGGWNRAFLVTGSNDGHVHSSMRCSTCRPTTRYAWMTDYSAKSEDEIVGAAGYRACTVCYPTAPLGDAKSLPTKMLTEDEKIAAENAAAGVEFVGPKAPTASGYALEVSGSTGRKRVLKTQLAAEKFVADSVIDDAIVRARNASSPQREDASRAEREKVIEALSEKHGMSRETTVAVMRRQARERSESIAPKYAEAARSHIDDLLR